jgi:hypothetical protein
MGWRVLLDRLDEPFILGKDAEQAFGWLVAATAAADGDACVHSTDDHGKAGAMARAIGEWPVWRRRQLGPITPVWGPA